MSPGTLVELRNVTLDMSLHASAGTTPGQGELEHWIEWIGKASLAYQGLQSICEDIVEFGDTPERLEAMKAALTQAQGQATYWPRENRW